MFVGSLTGSVQAALFPCLAIAGMLLTARVILRRDSLAWIAVGLAAFLALFPAFGVNGLSPVLAVTTTVIGTGIILASVRAGGLLATLVQFCVWQILSAAPLTLDVGRWYVWRSWFVIALVGGLAFWGFRNVLGRQSAFPTGALDG